MSVKKSKTIPFLSKKSVYFCVFLYVLSVFFTNFLSIIPTAKAQSAPPKTNGLADMAGACHDMKKDSELWDACEVNQDIAKDGGSANFGSGFGCGNMFYSVVKKTDPNDPSITETLWYTNAQTYLDCLNKAENKLNELTTKCIKMKRGSPLWKECTATEDTLAASFGCSESMFKERPDLKDYFTVDSPDVPNCQGKINAAKNAKLTDSKGKKATAANSDPPPNDAAGGGAGAGGSNGPEQPDCSTKLKSILSWVTCPVIDQGVAMTDFVFQDVIQPLLEDVPVSTNTKDGSYIAWSQFRLIANILLVGSLLAVVYSQAKGGGK